MDKWEYVTRGAYGSIYVRKSDNYVDVRKVMQKNDFPGCWDEMKDFFEKREIKIQEQLSSCPFTAKIFKWKTDDQNITIDMDFIPGESLYKVARSDAFSDQARIKFSYALCMAVSKIHENGIVHRDLSNRNILVNRDLFPVIIDFGLARTIARPEDFVYVPDVKITYNIGTDEFIAPEIRSKTEDEFNEWKVAENFVTIDKVSKLDIYAIGVNLDELFRDTDLWDDVEDLISSCLSDYPQRPPAKHIAKELSKVWANIWSDAVEEWNEFERFVEQKLSEECTTRHGTIENLIECCKLDMQFSQHVAETLGITWE